MMNTKNIIKNMITCIILTRIMCYNPFIMIKMNASMTCYQVESNLCVIDVAHTFISEGPL